MPVHGHGVVAALLPALKELRGNRRSPGGRATRFTVRASDGVAVRGVLIAGDPRTVVVVAHPAVVGSRYGQVVDLADELSNSFSVITFDFRGHGRSGGRCPLGFTGVSRDLDAVLDLSRGAGFKKVGVAGFSLGAAAAVLALSRRRCADAAVLIGCPPTLPGFPLWSEHPALAVCAMRLLGMRAEPSREEGPAPADVAPSIPGVPKLAIFGEWEIAPREEVERFAGSFPPPCDIVTVPGAWHADLAGGESSVREWLEDNL